MDLFDKVDFIDTSKNKAEKAACYRKTELKLDIYINTDWLQNNIVPFLPRRVAIHRIGMDKAEKNVEKRPGKDHELFM